MSDATLIRELYGKIHVSLSDADYELARSAGLLRLAEAKRRALLGRAGCQSDLPMQDIDGAAAEVAFARVIGVAPAPEVNSFRCPDVAEYHVRSTGLPNGRLIVRPGDSEDNLYVLLIGTGRNWCVIGSIAGRDAVRPEYWFDENGRPGCYMVPQIRLCKINLEEIRGRH